MHLKMNLFDEEHNLQIENGETILEAALREGHDPPFSCQIGACQNCKAKVLEGSVEMAENDSLTEDELSEGYVLTCQAHPKSDKIVIDYDVD